MNSALAAKSLGAALLALALSGTCQAQGNGGLPEFFGFYALDGGHTVALYEGQGSEGTKSSTIEWYSIPKNSKLQDTRPEISTSARFVLFYSNSGEMIQAISLYRLPVVQRVIESVPATAFAPPTRKVDDTPNTALLAGIPELAFKLLAKPVPGQPQMVELVASPRLTPGLYVAEYSPSGKDGWFAIFSVTSASETENQFCVDLILPGGPGGQFFRANSELGATVPLLAAYDYSKCGSSDRVRGNMARAAHPQTIEPSTIPAPSCQQDAMSGRYFSKTTGSQFILLADGSSTIIDGDGHQAPGHYSITCGPKEVGDLLSISPSGVGRSSLLKIQGDKLINTASNEVWVRTGDAPAPAQ